MTANYDPVHRFPAAGTLRADIRTDDLMLEYQPAVSLEPLQLIGFEALVRWNHPHRGLLTADRFIPVLEDSDAIVGLSRWVLEQACGQMSAWQRAFPAERPLALSVNTSPGYLKHPALIRDMQFVLGRTRLAPGSLRLEVAESALMNDHRAAGRIFRQLTEMNIGLDIDDFGTGPASLRYLRQIRFQTLKIDRSFVHALGTVNCSSKIIRAILDFAGSLGMGVSAEGVETREQLERLTALGCNSAQGYFLSPPLDAAGAEALIGAALALPELHPVRVY
jgi:EAL domain-containing protein (putative c-di-GMP-specific phosphodiesterase class I)